VGGVSTVMTFNAGTYEASDSTALDVFNLLAQNIGQTLPFSIAESVAPSGQLIVEDIGGDQDLFFTPEFGALIGQPSGAGSLIPDFFVDGNKVEAFGGTRLSGQPQTITLVTAGDTTATTIEITVDGVATTLASQGFNAGYTTHTGENAAISSALQAAAISGDALSFDLQEVQPAAGFTVGEGVPSGNVTRYGFLSQVVANNQGIDAYGAIVPSEVEGIEIGSLILQRQASSTPSTFINLYDTSGVGFPDLGAPINFELNGVTVQLTYRVTGRYLYSASGSAGDAIYNAFLNAVGTTVPYSLELA